MNTQYTPGPWRADWDDNALWYIEPLGITGVGLRGDSVDCVESATAHLIAAAPDLYEALKDAHRYLFSADGPDEVDRGELATQIEAALAKAEGR